MKDIEVVNGGVEYSPESPCEENLIICRPFVPDETTDKDSFSYYFVDPKALDYPSIKFVANCYRRVMMAPEVADGFRSDNQPLPSGVQIMDSPVEGRRRGDFPPRVLLLASSDTHAHLMIQFAERFESVLFVIPSLSCKDEGASERLNEHGVEYVEIDYADRESKEIADFRPTAVLCGADWTSEFIAVHAIVQKLSVPCVVLQEGPQDWDMKIKGKDPRKFRNAEIFLSQGAVVMKYIRPKYFAVTGVPKIDHIEGNPLPSKPRVLINCNFTYGQYEECRALYMEDALGVCRELELDYLISKHPRDNSEWDDPNLINSTAFTVKEQLSSCSIVVSRFSTIIYEALAAGRPAVYYNPHGERMRTFSDDESGGVINAYNRDELKKILSDHIEHIQFDEDSALEYMNRHCGPMDGKSIDRITGIINSLSGPEALEAGSGSVRGSRSTGKMEDILFSVIICTHNRATMLDRVLKSVLKNPQDETSYEILLVDNASTDQTRNVVKPYLDDGVVRYFFEPKMGLSNARNMGVEKARGKYVVFLDDDGEATEGWLMGFLEAFKTKPDAAAIGGRIVPRYEIARPNWISGQTERFYGKFEMGDEIIETKWVPGGNSVWKKSVIDSLGGFDPRLGRKGSLPIIGSEESRLIELALNKGHLLYYTPSALMYHHISKSRMTLSYMAMRYFGQGVVEARWEDLRRKWTRYDALEWCLINVKNLLSIFKDMIKAVLFRQKDQFSKKGFIFLVYTGRVLESMRFVFKGKFLNDKDCHKTQETERRVRIAIFAKNSPTEYSGGRYHSWMMAEALALAGHEVMYVTDNKPVFYDEFSTFPRHQDIDIRIKKRFRRKDLPPGKVDIVFLIPGKDRDVSFYQKILYISYLRRARLVLLNFETPNWFNSLSPVKRDTTEWDSWKLVSAHASLILSSAKESTKFARDYFKNCPESTIFEHCYPSINSIDADSVVVEKKEKRIILITRFISAQHKGGDYTVDLICEAMRGYTLVLIVGAGLVPFYTLGALQSKADEYGVTIDVKYKLDEREKFREIKRACLMLFPSFFEGFGLPPVESQYCNTPCICFDLPVLREVSGEKLIYVKVGDWAGFRAKIEEVLTSGRNYDHLRENIAGVARFENYSKNIDSIVRSLVKQPLLINNPFGRFFVIQRLFRINFLYNLYDLYGRLKYNLRKILLTVFWSISSFFGKELPSICAVSGGYPNIDQQYNLTVSGWALSINKLDRIVISFDGEVLGTANCCLPRADVLKKYPYYNDGTSGYIFKHFMGSRKPGIYPLKVEVFSKNLLLVSKEMTVEFRRK